MIRAKQLNWNYVMLVFVLVALLMVTGCGGSNDETPAATDTGGETGEEAAEEPAEEVPAIEGTLHETERVSMIVADGWEVMDIQGGLQAYKGTSGAVEVTVRGSGMNDDDALKNIEKFKADYNGTDVMELEAHGMTFYTTTFTSGMFQTKMSAMKDGEQYTITMAGADHLENDVFTGMVNSIEFK